MHASDRRLLCFIINNVYLHVCVCFQLSGSVMTMYSADFANVEVQGSIQFSINYVQRLREFHIFVAECRDLAAVDPKRGRSDP